MSKMRQTCAEHLWGEHLLDDTDTCETYFRAESLQNEIAPEKLLIRYKTGLKNAKEDKKTI